MLGPLGETNVLKHRATISVGTAALVAAWIGYSPSAGANPACPYDMNTQSGKDAFQQAIVASSQQVGQNQQSYGPNGNQTAAIADINKQRNMSNIILACQGIESTPLAPIELPKEPEPPVAANTPSSGVDCTQLKGAYDSLGPVVDIGDAVAKLNKMPGLSQVQGTSLALCGIDAIPNAIGNPSLENQQRVADAGCGAVNYFTNGLIDLCGTTPVGSN